MNIHEQEMTKANFGVSESIMAYLLTIGTCYLFMAPISGQLEAGVILKTLFVRVPLMLAISAGVVWSFLFTLEKLFTRVSFGGRGLKIALALAIVFTVLSNLACLASQGTSLALNTP